MNTPEKETNFNLIKNKIAKYFVQIVFSNFAIFYFFGALFLWQYLDIQGLRGEFSFLITSNNLLMSFALLGMFAASIIVFYLFYAQSLLKDIIRDSKALNSEKLSPKLFILHFCVLFFPLLLLLVFAYLLNNSIYGFLLCIPTFHLIGYLYWLSTKEVSFKWKRVKHCLKSTLHIKGLRWLYKRNLKVMPYSALVVFFAFYNIMPLFIIYNVINGLVDVGEILSIIYLLSSFALYSLIIAGLSVLRNRLYYSFVAIIFIQFFSLILVLSFTNVPLNIARIMGFGHYCTDIVLKEDAVTPEFEILLNEKGIMLNKLTLSNVYVSLHKDGKEYIVSNEKQKNLSEYIPYSIIEKKGFFKECPK